MQRHIIGHGRDLAELSAIGIRQDEDGTNQVYIGEAENVFERLNQHLSSKEFWTECIVFI